MSGSISYLFYAIDKPLKKSQQAAVAKLSRRAFPTGRRVEFVYHVDGYDIPGGYEKLMALYYDVMVRQDYEQWTLGMSMPSNPQLYEKLSGFRCNDGEGSGIQVQLLDEQRQGLDWLLLEITAYLDYEIVEKIQGLCPLPWERAAEEEEEEDYEDEGDYGYASGGVSNFDERLAQLTNCIREDLQRGDYRALYLAWDKLHVLDDNPEDYANPEDAPGNPGSPPKGMNLNRLPTYLRLFSRMLLPSDER